MFDKRRWLDPNESKDRRKLEQVGFHSTTIQTQMINCLLRMSHQLFLPYARASLLSPNGMAISSLLLSHLSHGQGFSLMRAKFPHLLHCSEAVFLVALSELKVIVSTAPKQHKTNSRLARTPPPRTVARLCRAMPSRPCRSLVSPAGRPPPPFPPHLPPHPLLLPLLLRWLFGAVVTRLSRHSRRIPTSARRAYPPAVDASRSTG